MNKLEIKDFSGWDLFEGSSEGSGRSEKEWLISSSKRIGLFKYPKTDPTTGRETTEHISEHLADQLGNVLGVKTAAVDIGVRNGRIGSMSYLVTKQSEVLLEGIAFISGKYPQYNANTLRDIGSGQYYCIDMIEKSTEKFVPMDSWIEMMLFDAIIGNADRHQSNWAVLAKYTNESRTTIDVWPCPLYDNGSSLCCYVNDNQLAKLNGKDPGPFSALVGSKSKSVIRIDGNTKPKPTHSEVIEYLLRKYPIAIQIANRFIRQLDDSAILELLSIYPESLLSPEKNMLIQRFLQAKMNKLRDLVKENNNYGQ